MKTAASFAWSISSMAILSLAVIFVMAPAALSAQELRSYEPRRWQDSQKNYAVEARLLEYDRPNRMVILQRTDDAIIQVPIDKLRYVDKRYVLRNEVESREVESREVESKEVESGEVEKDLTDQGASAEEQQTGGLLENEIVDRAADLKRRDIDLVELYGVNWVRDFDDASTLAGGSTKSTDDDKPIIWFRVLGDLEGFM